MSLAEFLLVATMHYTMVTIDVILFICACSWTELSKSCIAIAAGIPLEHNPNRVLNDIHRILIKLWL